MSRTTARHRKPDQRSSGRPSAAPSVRPAAQCGPAEVVQRAQCGPAAFVQRAQCGPPAPQVVTDRVRPAEQARPGRGRCGRGLGPPARRLAYREPLDSRTIPRLGGRPGRCARPAARQAPTGAPLTSKRPRRTFTPAGSPRPPWASSSARSPRSSASPSPPPGPASQAQPARPDWAAGPGRVRLPKPAPCRQRPGSRTRRPGSRLRWDGPGLRHRRRCRHRRDRGQQRVARRRVVSYQLTDGPDAGLVVYVAEDVTPTVQVGQHVSSATVIANMHNGSDGIETGWAAAQTSLTAESQMPEAGGIGGGGPFPTMVGLSFDGLLQSLGVPASPGPALMVTGLSPPATQRPDSHRGLAHQLTSSLPGRTQMSRSCMSSICRATRRAGGAGDLGITPSNPPATPLAPRSTVLHDPANPSTVAWPGSGSGGGRAEIVIGAPLLTPLAALAVWSRRPGARQRGRPHTGAHGQPVTIPVGSGPALG